VPTETFPSKISKPLFNLMEFGICRDLRRDLFKCFVAERRTYLRHHASNAAQAGRKCLNDVGPSDIHTIPSVTSKRNSVLFGKFNVPRKPPAVAPQSHPVQWLPCVPHVPHVLSVVFPKITPLCPSPCINRCRSTNRAPHLGLHPRPVGKAACGPRGLTLRPVNKATQIKSLIHSK
jgi:hypothetical protein